MYILDKMVYDREIDEIFLLVNLFLESIYHAEYVNSAWRFEQVINLILRIVTVQ